MATDARPAAAGFDPLATLTFGSYRLAAMAARAMPGPATAGAGPDASDSAPTSPAVNVGT